MKLSRSGRIWMALAVSLAVGLGITACAGGTIGYMWVLGTQYNQITGYKIDDFTGNLTQIIHSPFTSGGANPVSIAVRPGGRYVYVVNAGTPAVGTTPAVAGNVAAFAVGGDGILTFQQSYTTQGGTPVWVTTDSAGNFLYVLDQVAPDATGLGDITVYSIAGDTGRLSLVTNAQEKDANGHQIGYFRVGKTPTMVRSSGSCLYTLDAGDQTIYPLSAAGNGQLTVTTNSVVATNASRLTSINATGSSLYATDAGAPGSPGIILPYTQGAGCSLATASGGNVQNLATATNPVYTLVDSRNKFLYVLNQSTTNSQNANSTISAFTIDPSTGKLQAIGDPNNPYPVGSGPVCFVEDPSNQYLYTSNRFDGTVTGKIIDQNTGQLSNLVRGSSFPASGLNSCLAVSGNTQ